MEPLAQWPDEAVRGIRGVLTDIDDTLTAEGQIEAPALAALHALRAAGIAVVAITGRPVDWSEPFARTWPLAAIVAENGSVALQVGSDGGLRKHYQQDERTRRENFARMQQVLARIEREVPGACRARDSAGRETDIAIDHSEFTQLPQLAIEAVVRLMQAEGMRATISSIHINGWYGTHDKFTGAQWIVRELWGRELSAERLHWVYVGDSTNDQVMFRHMVHSVGVANILRFKDQLAHPPRYITQAERGLGFAELAARLLSQPS